MYQPVASWKILKKLLLFKLLLLNSLLTDGYSFKKRDYTINSKSICVANLEPQFERISCRSNNRIDIINAGLYNGTLPINNGTDLARCLPIDQKTELIKTVSNALKLECSKYSCLIMRKTIVRLVDNPSINVMDLVLDINYSCRTSTGVDSINSNPATYSFTYFFYIITLILSTSCILVGAIFILRKFLIMRRRNQYMAQRARHVNQGYVPNSHSEDGGNGDGNGGIWTTAYPPPAYDNIYENSLPINPLPDYSTLNNATKETKDGEIKNESIPTDQREDPPAEPYNVTYRNRDEIVTIVNPAFNPNDIDSNQINIITSENVSENNTNNGVVDTISVENLQIDKTNGFIDHKTDELVQERIGNQKA